MKPIFVIRHSSLLVLVLLAYFPLHLLATGDTLLVEKEGELVTLKTETETVSPKDFVRAIRNHEGATSDQIRHSPFTSTGRNNPSYAINNSAVQTFLRAGHYFGQGATESWLSLDKDTVLTSQTDSSKYYATFSIVSSTSGEHVVFDITTALYIETLRRHYSLLKVLQHIRKEYDVTKLPGNVTFKLVSDSAENVKIEVENLASVPKKQV